MLRVSGLGFTVYGLGFKVWVQDLLCSVEGLGFRASGKGIGRRI